VLALYTMGMLKRTIGTGRTTATRGALSLCLLALGASGLPLGCDDGSDGGVTPGTGGKGGTAGKGGSAGTSGSAGKGGTAGKGGKGGSGAQGGDGATGGNSAGGTGGGAGAGETGMGGSSGDPGAGGGGGEPGGAAGESGAGAGGASCESSVTFSVDEQAKIAALGPLGAVPADPTNAFADNAAAAALGQQFFFDKAFSGPIVAASDLGGVAETGKVACVSCHTTTSATMIDGRSVPDNVSLGANFHTRNAPGMVNSSFYEWTNWGGRFSRQWELPMPVTESAAILNSTRLQVAHVVFTKYKSEYEAVFTAYPLDAAIGTDAVRFPATGKPGQTEWDSMQPADQALVNRIFVNYSKALAAYTRKLVSRASAFDAFVAGDACAISDTAKQGLKVFVGSAGCSSCHGGSNLSDGAFHNLGVPQTGDHVPATDDGRYKGITDLIASTMSASNATFSDDPTAGAAKISALNATDTANHAAFRTPTLRGVAASAPYMHSGQLATLDAVIDFYDAGGGTVQAGSTKDPGLAPLGLTSEQKANLKAFLTTLTGEPVAPALLVDTAN
jgi:cytochrome c peroxidase